MGLLAVGAVECGVGEVLKHRTLTLEASPVNQSRIQNTHSFNSCQSHLSRLRVFNRAVHGVPGNRSQSDRRWAACMCMD